MGGLPTRLSPGDHDAPRLNGDRSPSPDAGPDEGLTYQQRCAKIDMECSPFNARHMNAVPGRKTDVKNSERIAKQVEHGLVHPLLVPIRPTARPHQLTHRCGARTRPPGTAAAEPSGGLRDQTDLRGHRFPQRLRTPDAGGADRGLV